MPVDGIIKNFNMIPLLSKHKDRVIQAIQVTARHADPGGIEIKQVMQAAGKTPFNRLRWNIVAAVRETLGYPIMG